MLSSWYRLHLMTLSLWCTPSVDHWAPSMITDLRSVWHLESEIGVRSIYGRCCLVAKHSKSQLPARQHSQPSTTPFQRPMIVTSQHRKLSRYTASEHSVSLAPSKETALCIAPSHNEDSTNLPWRDSSALNFQNWSLWHRNCVPWVLDLRTSQNAAGCRRFHEMEISVHFGSFACDLPSVWCLCVQSNGKSIWGYIKTEASGSIRWLSR